MPDEINSSIAAAEARDPRIVMIIVCTIAALSIIGLITLAALALLNKRAGDPALLMALTTLTSGLVGALTSLLVTTKAPQPPAAKIPGEANSTVVTTDTMTTKSETSVTPPAV